MFWMSYFFSEKMECTVFLMEIEARVIDNNLEDVTRHNIISLAKETG